MPKPMIFWVDDAGGKPRKQGVHGGSMWDQNIVNAGQGYGKAYFIDCETADEGRKIIASGKCEATKHKNVFAFGENSKRVLA